VTSPLANKTAQEDVEKALKHGSITPVMETQTAELVIVVRQGSGKLGQPTIGGLPTNDRPVVLESSDGGVRVGAQQGHPPPIDETAPADTGPHPQVEVGAAEEMFVAYQGL
jgi:hypothetical protein